MTVATTGEEHETRALTQQGGRLGAFPRLLWRLFFLVVGVLLVPAGDFPLLLGLLRLDMGGDRTVSDLVRLCDIIIGLLVLHECEPYVQGTDVENDGDGDVKETQQHHQLTGPVEKVEVDGGICRHLRGSGSV